MFKEFEHLIKQYSKQGVTPSKVKKSNFKTPEKPPSIDFFERDISKENYSTIKIFSTEETPKSANFALGALEEETIDTNKYKCMYLNRNQLGNVRQCKYCNIIFDTLDDLQDHTVNHFGSKLSSILPNNKSRYCPSCRQKFQSYKALKNHYGLKHYCTEDDLNGLLLWAEVGKVRLYFPISGQ